MSSHCQLTAWPPKLQRESGSLLSSGTYLTVIFEVCEPASHLCVACGPFQDQKCDIHITYIHTYIVVAVHSQDSMRLAYMCECCPGCALQLLLAGPK